MTTMTLTICGAVVALGVLVAGLVIAYKRANREKLPFTPGMGDPPYEPLPQDLPFEETGMGLYGQQNELPEDEAPTEETVGAIYQICGGGAPDEPQEGQGYAMEEPDMPEALPELGMPAPLPEPVMPEAPQEEETPAPLPEPDMPAPLPEPDMPEALPELGMPAPLPEPVMPEAPQEEETPVPLPGPVMPEVLQDPEILEPEPDLPKEAQTPRLSDWQPEAWPAPRQQEPEPLPAMLPERPARAVRERRPANHASPELELTYTLRNGKTRCVYLRATDVSESSRGIWIGRGEECNIRFKDPQMGLRHLSIMFQKGRFVAVDLNSVSGTRLNGKKLDAGASCFLRNGDFLRVGSVAFSIRILQH